MAPNNLLSSLHFMIALIDNYDSFTFNIVQALQALGADVDVFLHDKISVKELKARKPAGLVISPGPGAPNEAGISNDAIGYFAGRIPLLGVCLGHQCLAQCFGAKVIAAKEIKHGKDSMVHHAGHPIFAHMSNPFIAGRYHSLAVERETLPKEFQVLAWTDDDEIMAIEHTPSGALGVQFHPESILSPEGPNLFRNFLATF